MLAGCRTVQPGYSRGFGKNYETGGADSPSVGAVVTDEIARVWPRHPGACGRPVAHFGCEFTCQ